jgi:NADH-quinone oxidoreductase subunit N
MWVGDVYRGAPAPAVLLAGIASKAGALLVLARLTLPVLSGAPDLPTASFSATAPALSDAGTDGAAAPTTFGAGLLFQDPKGAPLAVMLGLMALASMLFGNLLALRQSDLPRLLGYSSVAHAGYLVALLGAGGPLVLPALYFYLLAYTVSFALALAIAGLASRRPDLRDLQGLVRHRPGLAAGLGLAMISLAGLPVTAGFAAKLAMFAALVAAGQWVVLGGAALGSVLGMVYYFRVLFAVAARDGPGACRAPERAEALGLAGLTLAVLLVTVLPFLMG